MLSFLGSGISVHAEMGQEQVPGSLASHSQLCSTATHVMFSILMPHMPMSIPLSLREGFWTQNGVELGKRTVNLNLCYFIIYFVVLGLELRAYTLSHSTSPFL
jgi:hypothetical protein